MKIGCVLYIRLYCAYISFGLAFIGAYLGKIFSISNLSWCVNSRGGKTRNNSSFLSFVQSNVGLAMNLILCDTAPHIMLVFNRKASIGHKGIDSNTSHWSWYV